MRLHVDTYRLALRFLRRYGRQAAERRAIDLRHKIIRAACAGADFEHLRHASHYRGDLLMLARAP